MVSPLNPKQILLPPTSHNSTSFVSPGSNLIEAPAGIFSLYPNVCSLGKSRALLTSKKCVCDPIWHGLSPLFLTVTLIVFLFSLQITGSEDKTYSPGIKALPPSLLALVLPLLLLLVVVFVFFFLKLVSFLPYTFHLLNGIMHCDQLGSIWKCDLHLNCMNKLRHSSHHIILFQYCSC